MADQKRTDPYLFEDGFERVVVALLAGNREFYERLGPFVEPDAFENASAKECARLTKVVAKELGRGPGSRDVVLQKFAQFARSGKATIDQKLAAVEYLLDLPKDFDFEPYAAVLSDIVQQRLQTKTFMAVTTAISQGKVINERTAQQFARLHEVGKVESFGSEDIEGDIKIPDKSTTGVARLDDELGGGLVVNGVGLFCAPPKGGKSFSLSGVAAAKFREGKFVAFLSTELPDKVQRARIQAAIGDCRIADLQREEPNAMAKAKAARDAARALGGILKIKRAELNPKKPLPGWTFDDVLFWLDHLAKENNRHPDVLVIDYADHLCAKGGKSGYDTGFAVYTQMVDTAQKRTMQTWTAAQGTRQKKEKSALGIYDFSDSMHKVRLVDLAVTISPGDKGFSILKIVADRYVGVTGTEIEPLPNAFESGYLVYSKPVVKREAAEPDIFEGFDFGGGDDVLH